MNAISPLVFARSLIFVELHNGPPQRMGREEDLQGAIVYLATDMSKWVTGQNLVVDGAGPLDLRNFNRLADVFWCKNCLNMSTVHESVSMIVVGAMLNGWNKSFHELGLAKMSYILA